MKTTLFPFLKSFLVVVFLIISAYGLAQTSIQDFGTNTGSHSSTTGTAAFIPNPTSGTTWARAGGGGTAPINLVTASNPLGTSGSYVRAAASSSTSVAKFSPWVGYSGGTEFYTSFKVLFGDASANSTATSGIWSFYQGAGLMYSDANDFAGPQVFTGLRFTYGAGGAITLTNRAGGSWSSTITTLSSATVYTVEIIGNNKSTGTINYMYNCAPQTVAINTFDLYINGILVGNDLAKAQLSNNASIASGTFIGISSTSNVANIFVDDAVTYNSVPAVIGSGRTVTFNANGGIGSDYTQTACSDTNLILNSFTRTGYSFAGWNTATDGSGTPYADGASFPFSANTTLYAQWTLNATAPTVTTTPVSSVTTTSATSGGNVTADGGASVTARGVAYGTTANPTIAGTITTNGGGTGPFTSDLNPLAVNTRYYYRAYATNSAGTGYGTESSFYTLANVPAVPAVSSPTTTTLNVILGSGDGNPALTEYAIHEATTGKFVQADGSLGATAVWQTAATWGTKTVTGLAPATTYTFEVKARNGASAETVYGATANGTTLANETLDYWNLQYPATTSISEGQLSENIYAQAYKNGLTEAVGQAPGLSAWIGYSSSNTNPNGAGWTWIPATYSGQAGPGNNNDEFKANLGSGLTPGTYYYASRFQINSSTFSYGGLGGNWNNDSGVLTVNSNKVDGGQVTLNPASTPEGTASTATVEIYEPGLTDSPYNPTNQTVQFAYVPTTDSNPSLWTGWLTATSQFDAGNNDKYSYTLPNNLTPGTYYVAARVQKAGSTEWQYFGKDWGTWSNSAVLTVNSNKVTWANIQSPVSGTIVVGDAYNVYSQVYKAGITGNAGSHAGITAWIGYNSTNAHPTAGGWTWVAATRNNGYSDTSNDEYVADIGTGRAAGTYYYASRYQMSGSTEYFYGGHAGAPDTGGEWGNPNTNISGTLTVQTPREINIKQGTTNIADSGSYAFGNQVSGTSSSAVTFTVENTGQESLSVGALSISGADASQFSITQVSAALPQIISGSGTTTFTVTFSPTSTGAKTAQLSLVNDDADENPYVINLTGTGTASAASDIIVATPYTYPTNIAYANYQATDITGGTNDIEIARFTIRDGGATVDADNLGTTVNSLTVGLTNAVNIRKIAIYDGATELGELAATASNAFSGLNIIVADGNTKDFSVRVSFNTSVTDNQQIQVSVTGVAAATSGSGFGTVNAVATVTGNENKIVVIADRLAFTTQPVTTGVNSPMSNVVVSASDNNNNKDLDYSGNIVITSTGTLTGSPVTVASASGVAAFNGLTHTVVGTGMKLTATSTGLADAISIDFDITNITYNHGDFRTKSSGTWSYNTTTPGTTRWEQYSSTLGWQNYVGQPTAATEYTAYITLNTEIPTDATAHGKAKIVITKDETTGIPATLVFNPSTPWTFRNVSIESGATLEMKTSGFNVLAARNFEIKDGGNFIFNLSSAAAVLTSSLWNGVEVFHPASNFIVKNHQAGANNYFFPPTANLSSNTYNGVTAYFGNLIFDPIVKDLRFTTTNLNNTTVTHGNLEIRPYGIGSGSQTLLYGSGNWTIGGNFIIGQNSNDTQTTNINLTTGTNTIVFNVKGDFINNSGNTLTFTSNTSASTTINLEGDMQIGSIGKLISAGSTNATLNFAGTWNGNKDDATIQTIDVANAATASNIAFNVNSGAYVKLINQDLALGSSSSFNVKNGGTLDFGFSPSNLALNITNHVNTAAFKTEANSTIKITSSEGITNTTGSGNVRTMTTGRVFDKGATYHYVGKVNQATGNGIPDQITGKLIVELETQNATQDDLEFRSTGTTTFGTTGGVNGLLEIRKGKVFDDPSKGFRNYNGTVDENNDGEADVQKGDLVMTGGKYVVSGGGFKPSLSGNYTLDSGTVEFAGNNNTKIRVKPAYFNVDVSGSNVTPGGKNLVVNNELKVISASAVLTIPEVSDNDNPYVVTAKKGIQIAEGGQAIFKNNANLMQEKDAVNTGNITMERKATVPSVQYNYWSSPVKDQPLYSLYPGIPDNKVMVYNSANDRFTVLPTSSNPKSVFAKGYSIKGSSNTDYAPALTATFVGEPHNETTAGINSILLSTAGSNYNLIGNPYPSNLNLLELFADEDNKGKFYNVTSGADIETPTAYFWDNTSNTDLTQQGSGYVNMNYALLNLSTGLGTPAPRLGTTGKKPNGIVKPGQGFIMRAAESGGSLTIKNTHRTTLTKPSGGTDGVYYKANEATTDKFWLTLTTPNQMNVVIALAYHPEAENSFERFDSVIFSEAVTENFYSLSSDARKLAIQSRKGDFNNEDKIPLGIKSSEIGLQKISLESKYGVFENQPIYLKDKLLNTLTNLSEIPYEFTMATGVNDHRFEIVYQPGTVLATDNGIKDKLTVYRNANDFIVKSKDSKIDEVEVYDVSGRLIIKVKGGSDELRIDASSYISGTYVLKIKSDEKTVTTKILK